MVRHRGFESRRQLLVGIQSKFPETNLKETSVTKLLLFTFVKNLFKFDDLDKCHRLTFSVCRVINTYSIIYTIPLITLKPPIHGRAP